MIEPFVETRQRNGAISYGLSSCGYDPRVASGFKIFTDVGSVIVDLKNFSEQSVVSRNSPDVLVDPPLRAEAHGSTSTRGSASSCSVRASVHAKSATPAGLANNGTAWRPHASTVSRVPLCPEFRTEPLNNG